MPKQQKLKLQLTQRSNFRPLYIRKAGLKSCLFLCSARDMGASIEQKTGYMYLTLGKLKIEESARRAYTCERKLNEVAA
jgi:hypothetical protein